MMPVMTTDSDPEQVVNDAATDGRTKSDRSSASIPQAPAGVFCRASGSDTR
jgi:hypothetical protein